MSRRNCITPNRPVPLRRADLPRDTVSLARFLLGKIVVHDCADGETSGRIVETEAYLQDDPACHAFRGATRRNRSLFLETGHAYVYLCYGTSHLLNVASEAPGIGAGVLLRALEPLTGTLHMRCRRPGASHEDLARGPGRLTAALRVDLRHDGADLCGPGPLWIGSDGTTVPASGVSTRIGISKGADARLRFFVLGNGCVSGPRRLNAPTQVGADP